MADAGPVGVHGKLPPAEQLLTGRLNLPLEDAYAVSALALVIGEEHVSDTVLAPRRQGDAKVAGGDPAQKFVGQAGQDAGSVAGVAFVADAAAMGHAAVHVLGLIDDLPAGATLDVADEADAATVFLVGWVV